ncbi:MAG: hypothetical protein ORN21_05190, partial [Methylophilaceae bacterium]|nr:hypothetical protein [Methylophilaceae bacterium]
PSLALASDTGLSHSDNLTNNPTVNVIGLEANASWLYRVDDGSSWVTGSGTSFVAQSGVHRYTALQIDAAGNTGAVSTGVTYTLDTTPPSAVSTLRLALDTGSNASDGITSNPTIVIGNLASGTSWSYQVDGSGSWVAGNGSSFNAQSGVHTYTAVQVDSAGNSGTVSTPVRFTLLTTSSPPTLTLASDTGLLATDGWTSNPTVLVAGLSAAGNWSYQIDGGSLINGGTGSSFIAQSGVHTYQSYAVDLAGNTSVASTAKIYTLDTTLPITPTLTLASDTGISASDGITNNVVINVLGLDVGSGGWAYQVDGTAAGSWIVGVGTAFIATSGAHSYFVRQTDGAGNVSTVSRANYTLDTSISAVDLNATQAGIQSTQTLYYRGPDADTLKALYADVATPTDTDIAIIQVHVGGVVTDSTFDRLVLGSLSKQLNSLPSNGTLTLGSGVNAFGVNWAYTASNSFDFSKADGTAFTPSQVNSLETALQFRTTYNANQGSRDFSIFRKDVAGNVSGSADVVINVNTQSVVVDLNPAVSSANRFLQGSGKALMLDGTAGYASLPSVTVGGDLTIEMWAKVNSFQTWARLIDIGNAQQSGNIVLGGSATGDLLFGAFNASTSLGQSNSTSSLVSGQWAHVALTVSSANVVSFFINGVQAGSGSVSAAILDQARSNTYVGKSAWAGDPFLNAQIRDVRVYDNARSATQIASDMAGNIDSTDSNL